MSSILFRRAACTSPVVLQGVLKSTVVRPALVATFNPILRYYASSHIPNHRHSNGRDDHVVIALGGNALLQRGQKMTIENQKKNIADGMSSLKNIIVNHPKVTIVHGNGPQVGLLVLQVDEYQKQTGLVDKEMKLDVLDAETEGQIGYLLESELAKYIPQNRGMATVLSQIVVSEKDPAFRNPTKFIGPVYNTQEEVAKLGLPFKQDGDFFRRVVPSPLPIKLIEQQMKAVKLLTKEGCVVICAGGGGIPVIEDKETGELKGIEAVIDKDRAATMIATKLSAQGLLILTDVSAVATDFGDPQNRRWIKVVSPDMLKRMSNHFPDGSMGPKVLSAIDFVEKTPDGGWCAIGSLKEADQILAGEAGTTITEEFGPNHIEFYDKLPAENDNEPHVDGHQRAA